MEKYDLAVVIGRFQPLHLAHEALIKRAFQVANTVLVLVGSAGDAPTIKNPFSYDVRSFWIRHQFPCAYVQPLYDSPYDDAAWYKQVHEAVRLFQPSTASVVLMGHDKDHTSFYLKELAKHWTYMPASPHENFDATRVRDCLFSLRIVFDKSVSPCVEDFLNQWMTTTAYSTLQKEWWANHEQKAPYTNLPFPPVFVTVDALVTVMNHVLLIKRKYAPGKDLWALPGGFLEQNETIEQGIVRELKEETGLHGVPTSAIRVFDNPGRSLRGRTITHVGHVKWPEPGPGPIKAADDASEARFWHLGEIENMRDKMFEDHWHIIQEMTK